MSDKPHNPALYGETRMSSDLIELWDNLKFNQVDLVGYSMGAIVAMISAASDNRIRKLVLGGVGSYQLNYDGKPLRHFDSENYASALLIDDPASISDPGLKSYRQQLDSSDNDRRAIGAHLQVLHRDTLQLDLISIPTLIIAGEDDTLSPHPDRLAAALAARRHLVLSGDHGSTLTTPEFIKAVVEFLT